ncbi:MAG: hypothetical protein NXI25_17575 [bacterium]|nr:hypothetical protein [bacterium]
MMTMTRFLFLGLTLALLLPGCAMRQLDRAQKAFNEAATIENQQRFSPQSGVFVSPTLSYVVAYRHVSKAVKKRGQLSRNNLEGNALALKALCEWKLNAYDVSKQSALEALQTFNRLENEKRIRMSRDETLMRALPDILVLDQVRSDLFSFHKGAVGFAAAKQQYQEQVYHNAEDTEAYLEEALNHLRDREPTAGISTEMETYLVLVQLAGLKTWAKGIDFLRESITEDRSLSDEGRRAATDFFLQERQQHLAPRKALLLAELSALLPGGTGHELYQFWDSAL